MRGLEKTAPNGKNIQTHTRTWQLYDWIGPVGLIQWKHFLMDFFGNPRSLSNSDLAKVFIVKWSQKFIFGWRNSNSNSNCDETEKLQLWLNAKIILWWNSKIYCDKTQKLKLWLNSKTQILIKTQNWNCDKLKKKLCDKTQ